MSEVSGLKWSLRPAGVQRLTVDLPDVDKTYSRVEFVLNGQEFVMSGPDAQSIGQCLMSAGGGRS